MDVEGREGHHHLVERRVGEGDGGDGPNGQEGLPARAAGGGGAEQLCGVEAEWRCLRCVCVGG